MHVWAPPMTIGVAGTFNRFHPGHKALLDRIIAIKRLLPCSTIQLGITSEKYATDHRTVPVRSEDDLIRGPITYLQENGILRQDIRVRLINAPYGEYSDAVDILVVSEESILNAESLVNDRIRRNVSKPLAISVVPNVYIDGKRVSSTSIIEQEQFINRTSNNDSAKKNG